MQRIICSVLLMLFATASYAEGEAAAAIPSARYIHLEPAFVVNYGSSGRMKYLRTEVSLKVNSGEAAAMVTQHKPYIRNNLVLLLSAQESETMNSSKGRESLRRVCLDEVRAVMTQLEGMPSVDDLYFSNFVVQN
ncbi:flagellar basal body-associated FliL family protein [Bacterioplanoides sp.]|uniref:flagellar basal body-associated FliL family protein n=1 Tax=Bacterioplanoides sp. TaxID=2066072 RepID=UPI003B00A9E7